MPYIKSEINQRRANWAFEAVRAFTEETRADVDDLNHFETRAEIIGDLLCDLLHYAQVCGHDPLSLHASAYRGFVEESTGEI